MLKVSNFLSRLLSKGVEKIWDLFSEGLFFTRARFLNYGVNNLKQYVFLRCFKAEADASAPEI